MITVGHEPLSWELLDYWRASGLPVCTVECAPIVVARGADGSIEGFAALGNGHGRELIPMVEALVARNLRVGLRVMDEMERLLRSVGLTGYYFFVNEHSPAGWREQIVRSDVFTSLGTQSGAEIFRREFRMVDAA